MISRKDEVGKFGTRITIHDSEDNRINVRAVITPEGESQKHVWLSVPTDYHIIVNQSELRKLHEVIGAMLVAL